MRPSAPSRFYLTDAPSAAGVAELREHDRAEYKKVERKVELVKDMCKKLAQAGHCNLARTLLQALREEPNISRWQLRSTRQSKPAAAHVAVNPILHHCLAITCRGRHF